MQETNVHLSDRAVVSVSGPDSANLLQGLVTTDVQIGAGSAIYTALLTPQGKILFDFLLVTQTDGYLIDCHAESAGALLRRLLMYRLRSKVSLEKRDDLEVVAGWDSAAPWEGAFSDPRLASLGWRAIVARGTVSDDNDGPRAWLDHRLNWGVPEGPDFGQDKILALDAGLEELHGVSFEKGCYVGQELTARMKHRGTARKRLLPIASLSTAPLAAGEPVMAGEREIGSVSSEYGARGFGLIRLDRLAEIGDAAITVAGNPLRVTNPDWLSA